MLELSKSISEWLKAGSIITDEDISHTEDNKVFLEVEATQLFENGIKFGLLAKRVYQAMLKMNPNSDVATPKLDSMKNIKTPAAKLYNWNLLGRAFEEYHLRIDTDTKSLIVAGDLEMLSDLLLQVYNTEKLILMQKGKGKGSQGNHQPTGRSKKLVNAKNGVDITSLNADKPISEVESCLEFLLVTLCRTFSLHPKQAAGLLTNSNKYLAHLVIKGLKSDFKPVVNWLMDVYANSKQLTNLMESEEIPNASQLMLSTFKPSFFSKDLEVAEWGVRLIAKIAYDLNALGLLEDAYLWGVGPEGFLDGLIFLMEKTSEFDEAIADLLIQWGRENIVEFLNGNIKNQIYKSLEGIKDKDVTLKFGNYILRLMKPISVHKLGIEYARETTLVENWIEIGTRMSDNNGRHSTNERALGLNLLTHIWITFPQVVELKKELPGYILTMLKRATRDKSLPLQVLSFSHLFTLLDTFASSKKAFAPILYKNLTFALVELHQNIHLRQFLMSNFARVFDKNQSIPVDILVEPLVKQMQVSENTTFFFKLFDFEFLEVLAEHTKLSNKNAMELFDTVGRLFLAEFLYAQICGKLLIKIAQLFLENEIAEIFAIDFFRKCLATLLILKRRYERKRTTAGGKQGAAAKNKKKVVISDEAKKISEAHAKLIMLVLEQLVLIKNKKLNEEAKSLICELIEKEKNIFRNEDPLLVRILEHLGDPMAIMEDHAPLAITDGKQVDLDESQPISATSHYTQDEYGVETEHSQDHYALALYNEPPSANLTAQQKIERQIAQIKQTKMKERERVKKKEENNRLRELKTKQALKLQLERRKLELGIASKNKGKEIKEEDLLYEDGAFAKEQAKLKRMQDPEIELINFTEEEDRDKEAVILYMIKFKKLFRFLFTKYANTGYKKAVHTFDSIKDKLAFISISEVTRMLKDHRVTQDMINRKELSTLIRLINTKMIQRNDLTALDYDGFQELFIQIASFIYSRPPNKLSHLPHVKVVESLVKHFMWSTKQKKESIILYEDPDATALGDPDILRQLNKIVETNPDYPIPEGYRKVSQKSIEFEYIIPTHFAIPEGTMICVELLDEIFDELFGLHIIEPIAQYITETKVQPSIVRPHKGAIALKYMDGIDKPKKLRQLAPIKKGSFDSTGGMGRSKSGGVAAHKTKEERKPKLSTCLKMEVAQAKREERPHLQEIAEVFEEILLAVESGKMQLVPRKGYGPGQIINFVKKEREEEEEHQKYMEILKEKQRKERASKLRQEIKDKKPGYLQEKEQKRIDEKKAKQRAEEKKKRQIDTFMKNRLDNKQSVTDKEFQKREEDAKTKEVDAEQLKKDTELKEKKRKEFFKQKATEYKKSFKEKKDKREEENKAQISKAEEEKTKKEKEKQNFEKFYKHEKNTIKEHKTQKEELEKFENTEEVTGVFEKYHKQLFRVFKFYSSLDDFEIDQELLLKANTVQFKTFVKFCSQFNITPTLISTADAVAIFNKLTVPLKQPKAPFLDYKHFKMSLVRFVCLSKGKLNGETEKEKKGESSGGRWFEKKKDKHDLQFDVSGMSAATIQNLFAYMDLDPTANLSTLLQKLNQIRIGNEKIKTEKQKKAAGQEMLQNVKDAEDKGTEEEKHE